jgi:hypothetical protein
MFEIEDGITVPEKSKKAGRGEQYPFSKLSVGQSFFVPNTESPTGDAVVTLKRTAYSAEKRFDKVEASKGKRFTVAAFIVKDNETGDETVGARVWRTE